MCSPMLTTSFLIGAIFFAAVDGFNMLGPANFIYKSAEQCPNAPTGVKTEITSRRINRTAMGLTIEIDSPYDFDDNLGIEMQGSQWLDGGWKPGAFYLKDSNGCEAMKKLIGDVFDDFKKQGNIDGCPFPKGRYYVENFVFDNSNFQVPQLYGKYVMKIESLYINEPQSCINVYFDLEPKNKI